MKRRTELLSKRLKELYDELNNDLTITEINIKEKSLATPALKSKWLGISFEEQKYLEKLEQTKEKLIKKYISKYGSINTPKYKTQLESLENDKIQTLERTINLQKKIIRFIDGALKIMDKLGYDIQNAMSYIKLEHG